MRYCVHTPEHDGNPPMGKKPDYNRYRRLLEQIIDHIANDEIRSRLKPDEQGFDFGKHADGECIPIISEEPIVNVYDAAIEEAERQMYGR